MKDFELNGKTVIPRAITFNTICDLEDKGYDISDMGTHTMSFLRVFVALWEKCSVEEAGNEIEEHISNGGSLEVLMNALTDAINESGFFNQTAKKPKKKPKTTEATDSDI